MRKRKLTTYCLSFIAVYLAFLAADCSFIKQENPFAFLRGVEAYWQRRDQKFWDKEPDYLHYMCRPEFGLNCLNTTESPIAR